MGSFTKTYNVEPTDRQRNAIKRSCVASVSYMVNVENRDIHMTTVKSHNGGIAAEFIQVIQGCTIPVGTVFIGSRGGIERNTIFAD